MPKIKVTQEIEEDMLADLLERARIGVVMKQFSFQAIADRYGLSYQTVYRYAITRELTINDMEREWLEEAKKGRINISDYILPSPSASPNTQTSRTKEPQQG